MKLEECTKENLWPILIETVHKLTMYPNHKAYVRENILQEESDITPEELAARLNLSLGEALVILYELVSEKTPQS
jgi:predicted nuclease of restriction endonuclease-like RecB superfamily